MRKFILAVDLGGTNTKIGLVDAELSIKAKTYFLTKNFLNNRDKLISEIVNTAQDLLKENFINRSQVVAVGVGVPGPVDFKRGKIHYLPNIPHWRNTFLRDILKRRMHFKIFVDNDVKLMTLAEAKLGAAKNAKNAVCLTLGTGVGGGLILEGRLFRGSSSCAGEIGHMPINIDGPRCNCGGRACLERYVGNKIILAQAKKKLRKKNINLEKLSKLAQAGDKIALSIYKNFAKNIGVALAGVVNLLNPEIIVIGGGLSFAGDFIFKMIKETINERAMPVQAKLVKIRRAKLGKDAGLIGAALLVKQSLIEAQKPPV